MNFYSGSFFWWLSVEVILYLNFILFMKVDRKKKWKGYLNLVISCWLVLSFCILENLYYVFVRNRLVICFFIWKFLFCFIL